MKTCKFEFRILLRILAGATGRGHEDEELNVEEAPEQQAGAKSTTPAPENAEGPARAVPMSSNTMRNSGTLASGNNFDDSNNAVQTPIIASGGKQRRSIEIK